ncbi:MAG: hypothetical protein QW128_03035 [Thermoprotei archaeon]
MVASPDGRHRVLFGMFSHAGRLVNTGRFMGIAYRDELKLERFNVRVKSGGYAITVDVEVPRKNIIVARYEDPVEGYRYCHNTEIADSTVTVEGKGVKMRLNCTGRTFYEYALTRKLDESLPEIVEMTS